MKYTQLDRSKKEELKIIIYDLREQGLGYIKIAKELEKQGIKISKDTVKIICNEIYDSRGERQPELKPGRRKIQDENINNLIYDLREQGLGYIKIVKELEKQGIKIAQDTVKRICNEIYDSRGERQPELKPEGRKIQDENINNLIYDLREQGLTYRKIVKEIELQGIKLSVETVRKRCKEIYELKGKPEPELRKKEIYKEQIYNLREQGLSYSTISEELEKQGIIVSSDTIRTICKDIYFSKGQTEPKVGNSKKRIEYNQELNEIIYDLREKRLSYGEIVKELVLQGITVDIMTVCRRCKKIYALKGETEPKSERVKSNKSNKKNDESEELNKKIYELREKGLTYRKIVEELEIQGIKLCMETIRKRCIEIYKIKGKPEPKLRKKEIYKEQIYILKKQGLSYREIEKELEKSGIKISIGTIRTVCEKIYALKGETVPQSTAGRPKKIIDESEELNKKINEQQLAKAILNLMTTRKATLEQVKIIADYYGVDLEKTMNSLEER